MEVRPLRDEADVEALLVAHGRAWRTAYEGLLPTDLVDRVARSARRDEQVAAATDRLTGYGDGRVSVVEDDDGTVRGYAVFRWSEDETTTPDAETTHLARPIEAELRELYVDPAYWGRGFGTALLEAGIERLPADVGEVALETLAGNDVATRFYEARGFERDGTGSFEVDGSAYPTLVYRRPLQEVSRPPVETKR